jgi:hypothetical protein
VEAVSRILCCALCVLFFICIAAVCCILSYRESESRVVHRVHTDTHMYAHLCTPCAARDARLGACWRRNEYHRGRGGLHPCIPQIILSFLF